MSILLCNTMFYLIIIPLVETIGYHHKTTENKECLNLIVGCYFIDMVLLPIIIGVNFSEYLTDQRLAHAIFEGKYPDFDAGWYIDVGHQLCFNMTLFAMQPYLDWYSESIMCSLYRFYYRTFVYKIEDHFDCE